MDKYFVCRNCIEDEGIQDFITSYASATTCSFCGRRGKKIIAAPLGDVIEHIEKSLHHHYEDPANGMAYESAEGGYQGETYDTDELLSDVLGVDFPGKNGDELRRKICDGIGNNLWCQVNPYSLTTEDMHRFSWDEFCRIIKYKWRFFFLTQDTSEELLGPEGTLKAIFDYAERANLFTTAPSGTKFYRARYQPDGALYKRTLDLGPPPKEAAIQTNRMSPPGIVMTYMGDDVRTALAETANKVGNYKVARFETEREALLLDFTKLTRPPTIFHEIPDSMEYDPRPQLVFLRNVAFEISKRIHRDDKVHLEYLPTQVITEYIRTVKTVDGRQIDGIRYKSSRRNAGTSVVLFADQSNLVLPLAEQHDFYHLNKDRWLKMVHYTTKRVSRTDLNSWSYRDPPWS